MVFTGARLISFVGVNGFNATRPVKVSDSIHFYGSGNFGKVSSSLAARDTTQ